MHVEKLQGIQTTLLQQNVSAEWIPIESLRKFAKLKRFPCSDIAQSLERYQSNVFVLSEDRLSFKKEAEFERKDCWLR
jgi:hypothetical protein